MSDPGTDPARGPASGANGGIWKTLLVVSLAFNLLAAGIVGGRWWGGHRFGDGARGGSVGAVTSELPLGGFVKTLSVERRAELRKAAKAARGDDKHQLRSAVREARREAAEALSAETFDQARAAAAFSRLDEAEARRKAEARSALTAVIGQMTPDERKAMNAWLKEHRPRMFRDPERRKRKEPGEAPAAP